MNKQPNICGNYVFKAGQIPVHTRTHFVHSLTRKAVCRWYLFTRFVFLRLFPTVPPRYFPQPIHPTETDVGTHQNPLFHQAYYYYYYL